MVPGLTVDLEAQKTLIKIPTTGYNEVKTLKRLTEFMLKFTCLLTIVILPSLPSRLMLVNEGVE